MAKRLVIVDKLDANNFLNWNYGVVNIKRIGSEEELSEILNSFRYYEVAVYVDDHTIVSYLFNYTERLTQIKEEYQFDGSDDVLIITPSGVNLYSAVLISSY